MEDPPSRWRNIPPSTWAILQVHGGFVIDLEQLSSKSMHTMSISKIQKLLKDLNTAVGGTFLQHALFPLNALPFRQVTVTNPLSRWRNTICSANYANFLQLHRRNEKILQVLFETVNFPPITRSTMANLDSS